jgi:hypothetical protein
MYEKVSKVLQREMLSILEYPSSSYSSPTRGEESGED